jgi:hypothetical protein
MKLLCLIGLHSWVFDPSADWVAHMFPGLQHFICRHCRKRHK